MSASVIGELVSVAPIVWERFQVEHFGSLLYLQKDKKIENLIKYIFLSKKLTNRKSKIFLFQFNSLISFRMPIIESFIFYAHKGYAR